VTPDQRDQIRRAVEQERDRSAAARVAPNAARRDPALRAIELFLVTAIYNDYLICSRIDGADNVLASGIEVAKPFDLRHDADQYPDVTTLTTVNAQKATATTGSVTETWIVHEPYVADATKILAAYVGTGVAGPGSAADIIRWMELPGRHWVLDPDS
jgi:hypothetical protein